jgi:hypothetical protein
LRFELARCVPLVELGAVLCGSPEREMTATLFGLYVLIEDRLLVDRLRRRT